MRKIYCFNAISKKGTDLLTDAYGLTDQLQEAEGVLVRSAALHDTEFPESLLAIARAGAGVNNIPLERCAEEGIVVFNTPGANANGVKELVIAGLMLASRDVVGGIQWCQSIKDDPNIAKAVEKGKKAFAGVEIKGKKLGVIGLGAIGAEVANAAAALGIVGGFLGSAVILRFGRKGGWALWGIYMAAILFREQIAWEAMVGAWPYWLFVLVLLLALTVWSLLRWDVKN